MQVEPDDEQYRIEIFKDKLRHSLSARFLLRFHASLIIAMTILASWIVDLAMLKLGVVNMPARYVIAILFAYCVFLLGVYLWIEYSGIRQYIKFRRAHELVGDDVGRRPNSDTKQFDWLSGIGDLGQIGTLGEGCFVVVALFFVLIVAFYFFGGFIVVNAATLFAEVVLQLLLGAGLLRGIRRYEADGWLYGVVNYTFWSLIFTLSVAVILGWVAQHTFPDVKTIPEAVKAWRAL